MKKIRLFSAVLALILALLLMLSACGGGAGGAETTGGSENGDVTTADQADGETTAEASSGDGESGATTTEDIVTEGNDPPVSDPGDEPCGQIDEYGDELELNMTAVWSIKAHSDAQGVNCRVVQGGCTDGTYIYVALNDGQSKSDQSISAIRKYDIATKTLVATFENLKISHCNDMTYNPETNEILMVHNSPDRNHISVYDADSLEFKEMITVDLEIYSMAYDPYEQCYWAGISYGYTFAKLDFNFRQVGDIYEGEVTNNTKQGMDIDSKYIYFLQYNKNCIVVYNKAGEFVRKIDLPKQDKEPENICHIGEDFYIGYYEGGGGTMYYVTLGEAEPAPFSVTMEEMLTFSSYTDGKGNTMKMAQGMCTDGTYLYIAQNNSDAQTSIIRKIDPKTGTTVQIFEGIEAGLTNDLLYNPNTNQIIAVHNGQTPKCVSVYNANTLAFVKKVTLEMSIFAMAYDSVKNCYYAGVSSTYHYAPLNTDFQRVGATMECPSLGNKKQGMYCDGKYFMMIMSESNTLAFYETDGTFITTLALPVTANAAQDLCKIGDTYYIIYATSSGGILYRATLTENR